MIEFLTAVLVIITGIYAYLNLRMAKASEASVENMREQSEAMLRPYINVSSFIRPNTSFLYLRISNTGKTGAENLKLDLDRDFFQWGRDSNPDKNLRNRNAFRYPIDNFPPDSKLQIALGQSWVLYGENANPNLTPLQFNITATYEFFGKKVQEKNCIDLRPFLGTENEHNPIVEELEKIKKVLEQKGAA